MLLTIESIKEKIVGAQCVTFDVFDTLLIRHTLLNPRDLFYFLARDKGFSHDVSVKFASDRIRAEALEREREQLKNNHSEPHIDDIYRNLKPSYAITSIDEINFERRILRCRPKILEIYKYAKLNGKKVFAISDIYLDVIELSELLKMHYLEFDAIYTSSEHKCGKYECKLFEKFLADNLYSPQDALHIGDNTHADYISAMKSGVTSVLIEKSTTELFKDSSFNLGTISEMHKASDSGSYFFGTLIAYIANRRESKSQLSSAQRFALLYAIPLLYFFCKWIVHKSHEHKVRKLFLMARDGYAISNVLLGIEPKTDFEVLNISRRAILFPAASIDKTIWDNFFTSASQKSLIDILNDLDIENFEKILSIIPNPDTETFSELSHVDQMKFLRESYLIALPQMERECLDFRKYANRIGLLRSDSAVVDVGWALSSHRALELVLGKKIRGYYVGKLGWAHTHDLINTYLFNSFDGDFGNWQAIFENGVELLELPFISSKPQTVRIIGNSFIYREEYVLDGLRAAVANEIKEEASLFLNAIKDLKFADAEIDKAKIVLRNIYHSLVFSPVPTERYDIGTIPHDRYIAGSAVETIGDYWMVTKSHSVCRSYGNQLRHRISGVIFNIRMYGLRVTALKIFKRCFFKP